MSRPRKDSKGGARHVRLYHYMLRSPAWQSLTANARAIYVEIAGRYAGPGSNNGRIPYACREASASLKIGQATAIRAIWELEERGFIIAVKRGAFSLKKKHATEWRLTEFPCDVTNTLTGSKEYMRWQPATLPRAKNGKNAGAVVKPSASVVKPHGCCGETDVA
jgi:hypothetical protein